MKRNHSWILIVILMLGLMIAGCEDSGHGATDPTDPPVHSHEYESSIVAPATCEEDGLQTFQCLCGHSYTQVLPALGDHQYRDTVTLEPTCAFNGQQTFTCERCGDHYTEEIPATGIHSYTDTVTKEATCAAEGERSFTCSGCDSSYTEVIPPTGTHSFAAVTTTPATCVSAGEQRFTCTGCGDSYTQTIPATGAHRYDSTVTKEATCTEDGLATRSCLQCGSSKTEPIPATDHDYLPDGEPTFPSCTEDGSQNRICIRCEDRDTEILPATGHDWLEATCTDPARCTGCGLEEGDALGHAPGNPDSYEEQLCLRCGEAFSLSIPWLEPGVYLAGTDMAPGEYYLEAPDHLGMGHFSVYDAQGILLNEEFFYSHHFITLEEGQSLELPDGRFTQARCIRLNTERNTIPVGMYRVGEDIPAGEYALTANNGTLGYFCIYDSSSCERTILSNDHFEETQTVFLEEGQYLYLARATAAYVPPVVLDPWTFPDAADLNEYAGLAFDAMDAAMTYISDSADPANAAYIAIFYNQAVIHIGQAEVSLEAMKALAESRESIPLADSDHKTLVALIDYGLSLCARAGGTEITFQNYGDYELLPEITQELFSTCSKILTNTTALLESFS